MNLPEGHLTAWHYLTREPVSISWKNGVISELVPATLPPAPDLWIAPVLVDLQINGYAGVDFQQDTISPEEVLRAASRLRSDGCPRFFFTLTTDHWPSMMHRLQCLCRWREREPALQRAILGWHLEGPFLSAEPGYCGAHDPDCMVDPTVSHICELREITGTDPVLLTLAPERKGASTAIERAVSLGMVVSLGHTNASAEHLRSAVHAGATGFTHFGNACPQLLDRHDSILWRVLDTPELTMSLIPDGIHVAPALFRIVHRLVAHDQLFYTTDAMAAAGAGPGRYRMGRLEVEVGTDQIVRQPGKTNFAGSALQPTQGVFRASRMLGVHWGQCWDRFSAAPTRFIKRGSGLAVGSPADFCLIRISPSGDLREVRTLVGGLFE